MCTVSWLHTPGGYTLFCNRDERLTRASALPPRIGQRNGVAYLAPTDAQAGGTWVGVNAHGLALCLLNRYDNEALAAGRQTPMVSRGLLVSSLLDCTTRAAVAQRITDTHLAQFQPFTLLVLEPKAPALILDWTGAALHCDAQGDARKPLCSSSFDSAGVVAARQATFRQFAAAHGGVTPAMLTAFHHSRLPAPGPYAVLMQRSDAATVSLSRVEVNGEAVCFTYVDCKTADRNTLCMIMQPSGMLGQTRLQLTS